ncbi:hypothetical protein NP493_551g02000 [Ridgeia piscesae]|uniref:Ig-like domain-containing protein n=1 Tax=Ridgeia piscesae TaxID=27915 RepID=A0AAD9KV60_RIDPI|nr:hypothetical protein NP493_551g02000 [Ridgeia piscesae]
MCENRRTCGLCRSRINMIIGFIAICGFIQLAVTSPPRFTNVSKKEIVYLVRKRVELPCTAQADPEPIYEWRKDGEPLDITSPDFQREPGTGTIIIPEPVSRHEGIYQCFAKNMYGTAVGLKTMLKKATLAPFPTMKEPKVHYPTIGEPLVLRCNPPFSYPKGILYWAESKPGARISAIDNSARVSQDFEGNLYFTNVEAKDRTDGDGYVCIVNNENLRSLSKGDDEKIYSVSSPGPPTILRPSVMWTSQPINIAIKGENLRLKCIFAGYPTPTVKWRRLDAPMPPKVNHTSFGQEIVITKIDETDTGRYECSATQTWTC